MGFTAQHHSSPHRRGRVTPANLALTFRL